MKMKKIVSLVALSTIMAYSGNTMQVNENILQKEIHRMGNENIRYANKVGNKINNAFNETSETRKERQERRKAKLEKANKGVIQQIGGFVKYCFNGIMNLFFGK